MRFPTYFSVLVLSLACLNLLSGTIQAAPVQSEQEERTQSDALYHEAQRNLDHQDYTSAVASLEKYLEFTKTHLHRPERVFWAIDQIGYVYLGVKRDAEGAMRFFRSIRDDERLTDLDRRAIDEWISVSEEWKKAKAAEGGAGIRVADQLFQRGQRYFSSGLSKEKMGGVGFARADFNLASEHLHRFALLHDKDPRIGEVLYMLGKIRGAVRADPEHWTDNFYLKEAVRRFPHTELARRAFDLLRRETSAAFHPQPIPTELADQLNEYEELARGTTPPE